MSVTPAVAVTVVARLMTKAAADLFNKCRMHVGLSMVCKLSVLNVVISAPATNLRLMSGYYYFDLHECPKYKDLSIGFMIGRRVSYCGDSLFL